MRVGGCLELGGTKRTLAGRVLKLSHTRADLADRVLTQGAGLVPSLRERGTVHLAHAGQLRQRSRRRLDLFVDLLDLSRVTVDLLDLLSGKGAILRLRLLRDLLGNL